MYPMYKAMSALSILIASVAVSAAGPTITNYNYWPNETMRSSGQQQASQDSPQRLRERVTQTRPRAARAPRRAAPSHH